MKDPCQTCCGQIHLVPEFSRTVDITAWDSNPRGAGYLFGGSIVEKFTHQNNLDIICRSHQLVQAGYQ